MVLFAVTGFVFTVRHMKKIERSDFDRALALVLLISLVGFGTCVFVPLILAAGGLNL